VSGSFALDEAEASYGISKSAGVPDGGVWGLLVFAIEE
jgi:hypothetical protein